MKNINSDFYTRQNTYNANSITLVEQIYRDWSQEGEIAVFLYSGQRVPKKKFPLLDELIGRHLTLNHNPTQNDILLFLGKNASCMTDPTIVLQITKLPSALKNIPHFWMLRLCRYCKTDAGPAVDSVQKMEEIIAPEKSPCVNCELQRISKEMEHCLKEQSVDEKHLAAWGTEIYSLIGKYPDKGLVAVKNVLAKFQKKVKLANTLERNVIGIPTGIDAFDSHTGGFAKGEMILLGSRPCIGKTALAANIAYHACIEKHIPTAFFSVEWSNLSICERMISGPSKADLHKIRSNYLNPDERKRVLRELEKLSAAPFFIDDSANLSIAEIRFRSTRLAERLQQHGQELGLIIIDYFQLIKPLPHEQNQLKSYHQDKIEILYLLKDLAHRLQVPVLLLFQLPRINSEQESMPQLTDMRMSDTDIDIADVIMFIHRSRTDKFLANNAELILAKHPRANLISIEVGFQSAYVQFRDLTE